MAEPKVLFGRSLTAIEPSLFPTLVLAALALLSLKLAYDIRGSMVRPDADVEDRSAVWRVVMLFAVMLLLLGATFKSSGGYLNPPIIPFD